MPARAEVGGKIIKPGRPPKDYQASIDLLIDLYIKNEAERKSGQAKNKEYLETLDGRIKAVEAHYEEMKPFYDFINRIFKNLQQLGEPSVKSAMIGVTVLLGLVVASVKCLWWIGKLFHK